MTAAQPRPSRSAPRIAYIAEVFPSPSETWVHHEIEALQNLGWIVRVFATWPRPTSLPPAQVRLQAHTTYASELPTDPRVLLDTLTRARVMVPALTGLLTDCPGLKRKAQALRDLKHVARLAPALEAFRPDVVMTHFAATRATVALFWSLLSGCPFAFKMHAADVFARENYLRLKFARAAHVLTISEFNIEFVREHYPDVNAARLELHACGIPLDEYAFQPQATPGTPPTILSVGRLVPMKGFEVLLRASRILLDQGRQHHIAILGDGPLRAHLASVREQLGLQATVDLAGYANPDEVRARLRSAGVFALPVVFDPVEHTQDGIPFAIIEAMALGVPVVSTTTSGIPELIANGVNGFLVPPNDPAALAQQVAHACELAASERTALLRNARTTIEERHDIKRLTRQLSDMLRPPRCVE